MDEEEQSGKRLESEVSDEIKNSRFVLYSKCDPDFGEWGSDNKE